MSQGRHFWHGRERQLPASGRRGELSELSKFRRSTSSSAGSLSDAPLWWELTAPWPRLQGAPALECACERNLIRVIEVAANWKAVS